MTVKLPFITVTGIGKCFGTPGRIGFLRAHELCMIHAFGYGLWFVIRKGVA